MVTDIRRLRQFLILAEELNFRAAAERLYLTQPAFSRSIATLEGELGVRLFERDKRHVELTAEGAALLEPTRELVRNAEAFNRRAGSLRPRAERELRVGLYGTALAELTHPVLSAFHDRHPGVSVVIRDIPFDRAVEPLFNGEIDVALLRAPCDLPSLTTVPLFTEPACVQLHADHPLAQEHDVDVHELFDDYWVALPPATPVEWNRFFVCVDETTGEAPRIGGYGRTIAEVSAMVACRHLVALVPGSTSRFSYAGVRSVAVRKAHPFRVVVLHAESPNKPEIEAFAETAIAVTRRRVSDVAGAEVLV